MRWLADNWFGDEAYVKLNERPVLLIFGPQYFTIDQLAKIMSDLSPPPIILWASAPIEKNSYGWCVWLGASEGRR